MESTTPSNERQTSGRREEALATLMGARDAAREDRTVIAVEQRIGQLNLQARSLPSAEQSLRKALQAAKEVGDEPRVAQIAARLGLTSALANEPEKVSAFLREALSSLRRAGAVDPVMTLLRELGGVSRSMGVSTQQQVLAEALADAAESLGLEAPTSDLNAAN